MDQLSAFRASTDSKSLIGFIEQTDEHSSPKGIKNHQASMVVMEPGDLGSLKSPNSPRSRMMSPSRNSVSNS